MAGNDLMSLHLQSMPSTMMVLFFFFFSYVLYNVVSTVRKRIVADKQGEYPTQQQGDTPGDKEERVVEPWGKGNKERKGQEEERGKRKVMKGKQDFEKSTGRKELDDRQSCWVEGFSRRFTPSNPVEPGKDFHAFSPSSASPSLSSVSEKDGFPGKELGVLNEVENVSSTINRVCASLFPPARVNLGISDADFSSIGAQEDDDESASSTDDEHVRVCHESVDAVARTGSLQQASPKTIHSKQSLKTKSEEKQRPKRDVKHPGYSRPSLAVLDFLTPQDVANVHAASFDLWWKLSATLDVNVGVNGAASRGLDPELESVLKRLPQMTRDQDAGSEMYRSAVNLALDKHRPDYAARFISAIESSLLQSSHSHSPDMEGLSRLFDVVCCALANSGMSRRAERCFRKVAYGTSDHIVVASNHTLNAVCYSILVAEIANRFDGDILNHGTSTTSKGSFAETVPPSTCHRVLDMLSRNVKETQKVSQLATGELFAQRKLASWSADPSPRITRKHASSTPGSNGNSKRKNTLQNHYPRVNRAVSLDVGSDKTHKKNSKKNHHNSGGNSSTSKANNQHQPGQSRMQKKHDGNFSFRQRKQQKPPQAKRKASIPLSDVPVSNVTNNAIRLQRPSRIQMRQSGPKPAPVPYKYDMWGSTILRQQQQNPQMIAQPQLKVRTSQPSSLSSASSSTFSQTTSPQSTTSQGFPTFDDWFTATNSTASASLPVQDVHNNGCTHEECFPTTTVDLSFLN